ncbi:MAG: hypothetical protein AB7O62_10220 [Pirellulales bacterium]
MSTASPLAQAADGFRREHRALDQLLARIREEFQIGRAVRLDDRESARLLDELAALRDHLGMLFALEESPGLSPDIEVVAPRLARPMKLLQEEHVSLFRELSQMIDYSERAFSHHVLGDLLDRIERRFEGFQAHFQAHEVRENRLILEAFNDEIGTGD